MANRIYTQSEHDAVVQASAETYNQLIQQGYRVTTNPGSERNQQVGSGNYPDIVVWKPDPLNPTKGTAVIIEEIETQDTVTSQEAAQWKKYGNLSVKFILLVPAAKSREAFALVQMEAVKVAEIWSYEERAGRYLFNKVFTLS
jgi:hypothetical protein